MSPSRDFLVRQSVLNAAAQSFPGMVAQSGAASALSWCQSLWGEYVPSDFRAAVIREYRALTSRFGVAA